MAKADYVEALSHNSGSMLGPLNLLVLQVDIYRLWKSYALDLLEIDCCCGGRVDIFRGTFSPPLPTIILPRNSRSPLFTSVFISWRKLLTFLFSEFGKGLDGVSWNSPSQGYVASCGCVLLCVCHGVPVCVCLCVFLCARVCSSEYGSGTAI